MKLMEITVDVVAIIGVIGLFQTHAGKILFRFRGRGDSGYACRGPNWCEI